MRVKLALAVLLMLAACATPPPPGPGDPGPDGAPPPIPLDGPIAYRCSDGTQLMVDVDGPNARVAIIGGPSMVLPRAGDGYYSNGRYGFRGGTCGAGELHGKLVTGRQRADPRTMETGVRPTLL
jgi:hypothetical protein